MIKKIIIVAIIVICAYIAATRTGEDSGTKFARQRIGEMRAGRELVHEQEVETGESFNPVSFAYKQGEADDSPRYQEWQKKSLEWWSQEDEHRVSHAESMKISTDAAIEWQAEQELLKEEAEIERQAKVLVRATQMLDELGK